VTAASERSADMDPSVQDAEIPEVTRLLVTYNSADILSYSRLPEGTLATVAVDNASRDGTAEQARAIGYRVIEMESNAGYSTAIMAGLQSIQTEFALITNPDLKIEPDDIRKLIAAARAYPDCDVFVPRIFKPDGGEFFRYETRFEPRVKDRRPPVGDACVPTLSGAALLVRTQPFIANGGFDTKIFLYFEDDELSLRYQRNKWPMIFVGSASAVHVGDASSPPDAAVNRIKNVSFGWSWAYVMALHGIGSTWLSFAGILGKFFVYAVSFRGRKLRRQMGVLEGFARYLAGQPAPFFRKNRPGD
jgi:N-acetylglucosaminyl-diphospho-decaprenol L-rhamnosyltransferase